MRKYTALFAALAAVASLGLGPEELGLQVRCRGVRQGEPLLLVLASPTPVVWAEGQWCGRPVRFGADGERLVAVAAVDRNCTPGEHELRVRVRFEDGTEALASRLLTVGAVDFPRQELSVDPRFVRLSPEDLERVRLDNEALRAAYAAGAQRRLWSGPFVAPADGRWSAPFGVSRVFNGEERSYHRGADLAVPTGTPISSCNYGRVVLTRDLFFGGNTVIVDHGLGVFSGYLHLSEITVGVGQEVGTGEIVGLSGATGRVTGPHLHWMLRVEGVVCDPRGLLEIDVR